jgi:hypothetical protein
MDKPKVEEDEGFILVRNEKRIVKKKNVDEDSSEEDQRDNRRGGYRGGF